MRMLDSVQAIHDRVAHQAEEVRFTYFVQAGDEYKRRIETEISVLEAIEQLRDMQNKTFLVKQVLDIDNKRFIEEDQEYLHEFLEVVIELTKCSDIKLYNLIRVDYEIGGTKYIVQYKACGMVHTWEFIEQINLEESDLGEKMQRSMV